MPKPRRQSTLRAPLNAIFGTEANVRLLRVLVQAESPVAAGELARRAELGRTSIYPALEVLEQAGIVAFVGTGGQRNATFRRDHPLGEPIADLFLAESRRLDTLVAALRVAFKDLAIRPTSIWLEDLSATEDVAADTLGCYIVADPKMLPAIMDLLSAKLEKIESKFDVRIDVHGMTRSELRARSRAEMAVLPTAGITSRVRPASSFSGKHEDHDARARKLAVAIAAKLKRDPALARRLRKALMHRLPEASPQERRELKEWARVLTGMTPARLQRFLVEDSERATRLRQTLPAMDVLTPSERMAVLASATDSEARSAVTAGRVKR
jgi:DNA-binding transcriptional ArsR family regulator